MFSRHTAARKLREIRRCIEVPLGLDAVDPDEMIGALCRWATGLPFILELPRRDESPTCRWFVVDCPILGWRAPWLSLDFGDDGSEPAVLVALPRQLARRGVAVGWAICIHDIDDERVAAGVALPTSFSELQGLQGLLEIAYVALFSKAGWPA